MFKKEDIKPGYLLEIEKGGAYYHALVTYGSDGDLCYSSEHVWAHINSLNENLEGTNRASRVTKVYGYAPNACAYKLTTLHRSILWERKPRMIKEISAAEAEKLLKEKFPDYDEVNIVIKGEKA